MSRYALLHGGVLEHLRTLPSDSADGLLCDPPYGLRFMGRAWDYDVPSVEIWREALRVLKPGAPLMAFGGSRTYHRMTVAIEDAGFEIRDCLMWLYGSGFPKGARVDNELFKGATRCLSNASASYVEQVSPALLLKSNSTEGSTVVASARIRPEGAPALLIQIGREDGSSALTAISLSTSDEGSIASNTTLSWSSTSVADLNDMSKSTTGTLCATTTDSKTWNLLTGLLTFASTTPANATLPSGLSLPACNVVSFSNGVASRHAPIPALTALGSATANPLVAWGGYNLAIKPAFEPIILARKPLDGTMAANVARWGVGGLNIDGSRIGTEGGGTQCTNRDESGKCRGHLNAGRSTSGETFHGPDAEGALGRWPANVLLDEEAAAALDAQSGNLHSHGGGGANPGGGGFQNGGKSAEYRPIAKGDSGGASRFFYTAKVSKSERERGCAALPLKSAGEVTDRTDDSDGLNSPRAGAGRTGGSRNHHPTLKPISLIKYLAGLILPPTSSAVLLVPFSGSGSEVIGALQAGWPAVLGIEREEEYVTIARARIPANVPGARCLP